MTLIFAIVAILTLAVQYNGTIRPEVPNLCVVHNDMQICQRVQTDEVPEAMKRLKALLRVEELPPPVDL